MRLGPLFLSTIAGGVVFGALASQAIPVAPHAAGEPAWRALVQPQYRVAYTPARGTGPEDASVGTTRLAYAPDPGSHAYRLPPELAAAERFAAEEARAVAELERPDRLTEATGRAAAPEAAAPSEQLAVVDDAAVPAAPPADAAGGAKVVTLAAVDPD